MLIVCHRLYTVFGEYIAKHPKLIIILVILSLFISGYYASQVRVGVNTGRFELKNDAYETYRNIVHTFGSELDNVIIVCVSEDGSVFHKQDMLHILKLENKINNTVEVASISSVIDYVATGMHILSEYHALPKDINVTFPSAVFTDINNMNSAISNYQYVLEHGNASAKNDSYRVFMLLPAYMNSTSGSAPFDSNFSYTYLLNHSAYQSTMYNATNILIDEIDIYENISKYNAENEGTIPVPVIAIPENYSLSFVNDSIAQVNFNITRDKIGMEYYNTTYIEWYAYNLSAELGLSLLYSGHKELAMGVYSGIRDAMLNDSQIQYNQNSNWSEYSEKLLNFMQGKGTVQELINKTEDMKNKSFGTLHDFLNDYAYYLREYTAGNITWERIVNSTNNTRNIASLMLNYTSYSRSLDLSTLPTVNATMQEIENSTGTYSSAMQLLKLNQQNMLQTETNIATFYGEYMLYNKILDILNNMKSILIGHETNAVKEHAWKLLLAVPAQSEGNNTEMNITPFHSALLSYRRWIFSPYYGNFTEMMYDYLSMVPFELNYTPYENITYSMEYTHTDMIDEIRNMSQSQIYSGIENITNFDNSTIEWRILEYQSSLNHTARQLMNISKNISWIYDSYNKYGGPSAAGFLDILEYMHENTTTALSTVNNTKNSVFSLRLIEDYFSLQKI